MIKANSCISIILIARVLTCVACAEDKVYAPLSPADVRGRVMAWVAESGMKDKPVLDRVGTLWAFSDTDINPVELFELTVQTFALCDANTEDLMSQCRFTDASTAVPSAAFLDDSAGDPFLVANVRLYFGRYLTQRRMYDEALLQFDTISVEHVIDPATYFFYRAVCEQRLMKKSDGLATLDQLLNHTESMPTRYRSVATLMRYDLTGYREKSLDEVARKMSDVERRLQLGRGGSRVQKVEDEIVAALDELIKRIEDQSGSSSSSGTTGGSQNQSSGPASDSVVKGATAPGNVDEKDIGHKTGWGTLPPKKETEAKNLINRNFPAHYRQAIEQYFKKLANRRAKPKSSGR